MLRAGSNATHAVLGIGRCGFCACCWRCCLQRERVWRELDGVKAIESGWVQRIGPIGVWKGVLLACTHTLSAAAC